MKTFIRNGRIVNAVDDYEADVFIGRETVATIGKGGLYRNVIRTGMMLNLTTDNVDELIRALDKGLATL